MSNIESVVTKKENVNNDVKQWKRMIKSEQFKSFIKISISKNILYYEQGINQVLSTSSFTINDKVKDNLTTFGYIRSKWRETGIDYHLFPPEYLIRIICGYYRNEWIHLFTNDTGEHYKINVFAIIDK